MTTLSTGSVVATATRGDDLLLTVDGDQAGRGQHGHLELGDVRVALRPVGGRRGLLDDSHAVALRLDRAGSKATWLTLADGRYRLARQRAVPLRRTWIMRSDIDGATVLTVTQTPLGTRAELGAVEGLDQRQRALLVLGALVEVLGLTDAQPVAA